MKKILCMTLTVIVFLFSLSGCNTDKYVSLPDEYVAETDYPSSFAATYNRFPIAPGEGGYYFTMGDFLFFMDGETKEIAPVCSRPDCRHENESDQSLVWQCNAYVGTFHSRFLQVYEGNLYCLSSGGQGEDGKLDISASSRLLKVALDGTAHEFLCPMPQNLEFTAIHRGYLYYAYYSADGSTLGVYRKKMTQLNEEAESILEIPNAFSSVFLPYGTHLYMYFATDDEDGLLYDYNINSKEVSRIEGQYGLVGVYQNNLLLTEVESEEERIFGVYDRKTNTYTRRFTVPSRDETFAYPEYASDGTYLYQFRRPVDFLDSMGSEDYNRDHGKLTLAVYNMEGMQIDLVELIGLPDTISFAPGDEEYGFFWYEKIHDEEQPLCMDLLKKKDGFQSENIFRRCYAELRPGLMYTE